MIKKGKKIIRRKVVCVWGEFTKDSKDFVLEPPCSDDCKCEVCIDSFFIEGEDQDENKKTFKEKEKR